MRSRSTARSTVLTFTCRTRYSKALAENAKSICDRGRRRIAASGLADPVKPAAVTEFINDADKAKPTDRAAGPTGRVTTREDKDNVMFEARDEKAKVTVHKSYVKKN